MNQIRCNLLVGVSASVNAINVDRYLDPFRDAFAASIKLILTRNAKCMLEKNQVDLKALEARACDRIFVDSWDLSSSVDKVPHIQLSGWADLFVIVPATANIMGKAANGVADDLLSTTILSYARPIIFAPAMNKSMWYSAALQRNKKQLEDDGHRIVPPSEAMELATGEREGLAASAQDVLVQLGFLRLAQLRADKR